MLDKSDFQDLNPSPTPRRGVPKVRRPTGSEDVTINADEKWRWPSVRLVEFRNQFYLVAGTAAERLAEKIRIADLVAAATGNGKIFVWPVAAHDESAKKAADAAAKTFCRVVWDGGSRSYRVEPAGEKHAAPNWSYESFDAMVEQVFKGRVISDPTDPLIDKVLGQPEKAAP